MRWTFYFKNPQGASWIMEIKEQIISVKNYVTKSNLPDCDFVINPYVGCPHACKYCYACFMKRFTNHAEKWGTFIDIKTCPNPVNTANLKNNFPQACGFIF